MAKSEAERKAGSTAPGSTQAAPRPVRRKKAKSPLRWLRRLILALALLSILGIGLLLAAYRFGATDRDPVMEQGSGASDSEGNLRVGQGFEFTQTHENQPVFRIRAARDTERRDKTALLEEVELTLYRSDGGTYLVTSRTAIYDPKTQNAQLEGDVVMRGWQDLVVRTRALELRRQGQIVESLGEVQFDYPPDLTGRASKMRFDFRDDSFILSEGVHLKSVPGAPEDLSLTAERLSFQQDKRLIRASKDVVVERGGNIVRAQTLGLFLREDRRTLESLRARFGVSGVLVDGLWPGPRTEARFQGENLILGFAADGSGAERVDLDAGENSAEATLDLEDETGLRRRITGREMKARLRAGRLRRVETEGKPVELVESIGRGEELTLRHACAGRIESVFNAAGELETLKLTGQVELSDRQVHLAGGDSAEVNMKTGSVRIAGVRGVELFDNRGAITAPSFDYRRDKGVIRAEGGVRTLLEESATGALERTPLARGRGPVQVDSDTGIWTLDPPTFAYRGNVRAWRGDNLLLAEQLRGENATRKLSAQGGVKSVWQAGVPGQGEQPVEVTARQLVYEDPASTLIYEGGVKIVQESQEITCRQLTVELGSADRQAEKMICEGQVQLKDPVNGRRLFGDRAVYSLSRRLVEVFGEKVRLLDGDGSEVEGRYLTYDVDSGGVRLKSSIPEGADASP